MSTTATASPPGRAPRPPLTVVGARRRTVLYARVSKPNRARKTVSVDQQLDVLRDRGDREHWDVVAEHADRARSASRYATRAREDWPAGDDA